MQYQALPEIFYNVYTPTYSFATALFTMTPACGYNLMYEIKLKNIFTGVYRPLPSWLVNTGDLAFSVQTNDSDNVGVYLISIIGRVPKEYMDPAYSKELIVVLNVGNDCLIDEVTPLSYISN